MTNNQTIRSKRSRISGFKQPFIASMLSTASFVASCDDHPEPPVDGSSCPAKLPSEGQSCAGYDTGLTCGDSCTESVFQCADDGAWTEIWLTCNPPPPPISDCPPEPIVGESCLGYEPRLTCYGLADCGTNYAVMCGDNATWEEVRYQVYCNPPMPIEPEAGGPAMDAGARDL